MRIPLDLLRLLVFRALVLWGLIRVIVTGIVMAIDRLSGVAYTFTFLTSVQIVVVVTVLFLIDVARRGERFLFANLGVDRRQLAAFVIGVASVAELVTAAAFAFA